MLGAADYPSGRSVLCKRDDEYDDDWVPPNLAGYSRREAPPQTSITIALKSGKEVQKSSIRVREDMNGYYVDEDHLYLRYRVSGDSIQAILVQCK